MARISGVDLPKNKRMEVALTYIYGIGQTKAKQILKDAGVSPDTRTDELADSEISAIRNIIKRLMDIGAYRGLRHRKGLPVRGQRTHTNSRTRKGPRRSIAGKKK